MMPKGGKLACSCGYKKSGEEIVIKEKGKESKQIEVVSAETDVRTKIETRCPKCKHKEAYTWDLQTRAGDEPPTRFFKCTKCEHSWREYR